MQRERIYNSWSESTDNFLLRLKQTESDLAWYDIAQRINDEYHTSFTPKACRERYVRQLDLTLVRGPYTPTDIQKIIELLKTGKYFKGGDIESAEYRGIGYAALGRKLNRPDHLLREGIIYGKINPKDPYLHRVMEVENNRIRQERQKAF